MSLRFAFAMARREARASRRRLAIYIAAIVLGVAAFTAINSFRSNVVTAVRQQSRALLGADLQLGSRWEFGPDVQAVIDSLEAAGASVSRSTSFSSMALTTRSRRTRLVEVQGTIGDYPYYGEVETDPPGLWTRFRASRQALVDPTLLVQLDARLGDTLAVGQARFVISGTVTRSPRDLGLRSVIGPRVYVPGEYLEETGLLRFGSVSYHQRFLKIDDAEAVERLVEAKDSTFEANRVWYTTVEEYQEDLTSGLDRMSRFLALVGLVALLLGGIGVASGVHVFVSEKLDSAAVLRCLGAGQRQTFSIYVLQATAMGLTGALLGVALGITIQALLPGVLRDFLPLDIPFRISAPSVIAGLAIGVWVSVLFALIPLLRIKDVAPLRALRRDYERRARRLQPLRVGVYAALGSSLLGLALWQAPEPMIGLAFAGAAAVGAALLGLAAWSLMRISRRLFPRRARFATRQGIANLFRPQNQTLAVTLALGAGAFLITLLFVVQRNLLDQIVLETRPDRPNILIFDVQLDQEAGVKQTLAEREVPVLQRTPIVPARLVRVGERSVEEILADTVGPRTPRWALLREYRHTYRDTLVGSERLVAGDWFDTTAAETAAAGGVARISLEEEIAGDLHVGVGNRLTWEVQGVPLETEIANLRSVDWARFEPNFFAVFEPGVLDEAPQSLVMLTRADDPVTRAELQRDLVLRYPNVAAVDLSVIIEAVDTILSKVAVAIRFMALFSIGCGLVILVGAIGTSRFQRARESITLKTIGATSATIRRILATEYFALGSAAGLAGILLAGIAGWIAITFLFELTFRLPVLPMLGFWAATALLTTLIGLANSRDVIRRTPLEGMRELAE